MTMHNEYSWKRWEPRHSIEHLFILVCEALYGSRTVIRYNVEDLWISIETAFRTPSSFRCSASRVFTNILTIRNFTAMI